MNTLLLPTLARCLQADPDWASVLGKARALPDQAAGLSAQIHAALGLDSAAQLPWATLLAAAEGLDPGPHRWLALEPLCLRVAPNGVYVVASNDFGQSNALMRELWASIEPWLLEEGIELHAGHAVRAFLRLPAELADPDTVSAEDLLGVELTGWFPPDRQWRRRLNEYQIQWSQHPLNQARLQQGLLPVNSPWFGRASTAIAAPATSLHSVFSSDPLLHAAARWAGLPLSAAIEPGAGPQLLDLRDAADQALQLLTRHGIASARLNFACGKRFGYSRWQRLWLWRGKLTTQA